MPIDLLPGAVRPLLEADLPLVLWWTGDPRKHEPLFRDLADECSRLILDLPDPGADAGALRLGLDPALGPCSRDSAWFGLARWRELVAQFFDPPATREKLNRIDSVHHRGSSRPIRPSRPGRRSGWSPGWPASSAGSRKAAPSTARLPIPRALCRHDCSGPRGEVPVSIVTRAISRRSVRPWPQTRRRDHQDPAATRGRQELRRDASGSSGPGPARRLSSSRPTDPDSCRLPRGIDAPELDAARRVATALESSRIDIPFRNALPIALWLMEPAECLISRSNRRPADARSFVTQWRMIV